MSSFGVGITFIGEDGHVTTLDDVEKTSCWMAQVHLAQIRKGQKYCREKGVESIVVKSAFDNAVRAHEDYIFFKETVMGKSGMLTVGQSTGLFYFALLKENSLETLQGVLRHNCP